MASPTPSKRPSPKPGAPVRGSSSGRPVMALLDLLGRRWALRILWELRSGEALGFRALQERCDKVSPDSLNRRLRELAEAKVVEHDPTGAWRLTTHGLSLIDALEPLQAWAQLWARRNK